MASSTSLFALAKRLETEERPAGVDLARFSRTASAARAAAEVGDEETVMIPVASFPRDVRTLLTELETFSTTNEAASVTPLTVTKAVTDKVVGSGIAAVVDETATALRRLSRKGISMLFI